MMNFFLEWFAQAQAWLFETLVQPLIFELGLGDITEQAFEGTEWFLVGVCELILLFLVLRPLEAMMPVQPLYDRRARLNDFAYTVLHRLGIFAILIFFVLDPLLDQVTALLHLSNVRPFNLESLWPGMGPLTSFFVYLLVFDFFDYWFHRMQHHFNWWWGLHSLHHSQQNMNLWSDNRNHLLDDLLRDVYIGVIALALGVAPSQYVLLVSFTRCLQSLQHANVRIHFGWLGERLLVSPRYHRLHHGIGLGHESHGPGTLGGCNFAVLFPLWDILFRTFDGRSEFVPTGVRDQLPPPQGQGRDYGKGFFSQQWLGLLRMIEFFRRKGV
jgi:sterol desaturase/sphingolipid hydroxylase (fatty acid hydroxylase superfamily)